MDRKKEGRIGMERKKKKKKEEEEEEDKEGEEEDVYIIGKNWMLLENIQAKFYKKWMFDEEEEKPMMK